MKKIIFIIITFLFTRSFSQLNYALISENIERLPKEQIHLHYNNEFLLTGETLYYKAYCLDDTDKFSSYSKIAYLELKSSNNKTIIKQKINLKNGGGSGDFFINTTIKTGVYKLLCYTQWMKNYKSYFEKNIFILNPSSYKLTNKTTSKKVSPILPPLNNSNLVLTKSTYKKREKVTLNLKKISSKYQGDYSISIKRKNNFHLPLNKSISNFKLKNKTPKNIFYLPELRGALIHGKINARDSSNISGLRIALSINSNHLPLIATTNNSGEFYFNITNLNANKIYIQILESNSSNYEIKIIENENLKQKDFNYPTIKLNQKIINDIENRILYSQIENAYYSVKKDTLLTSQIKDFLLENKKTTYKLDDYKRFKTLKETLIEIIEKINISKKNNQYTISIQTTNAIETSNISNIPSLLIVDGHIINNLKNFIDFDSRKINTISIINDKYFYGYSMYKGIIYIETFKKNYFPNYKEIKEFKVTEMQPQKKYFFQRHDIENKRIPDFRSFLYWNPNINTTQKEITFYTSNVIGDFEIDLQGYSKEGKLIHLKQTFSVQ